MLFRPPRSNASTQDANSSHQTERHYGTRLKAQSRSQRSDQRSAKPLGDVWSETAQRPTFKKILMHSYVDDFNPLIITSGSTQYRNAVCNEVSTIMDEEATANGMRWDPDRDSRLPFNARRTLTIKTLGLTIDNKFRFTKHIQIRTKKGSSGLQRDIQATELTRRHHRSRHQKHLHRHDQNHLYMGLRNLG